MVCDCHTPWPEPNCVYCFPDSSSGKKEAIKSAVAKIADAIQSYDWWPMEDEVVRNRLVITEEGEVAGLMTSNYYPNPRGAAMMAARQGDKFVALTEGLSEEDDAIVRRLFQENGWAGEWTQDVRRWFNGDPR